MCLYTKIDFLSLGLAKSIKTFDYYKTFQFLIASTMGKVKGFSVNLGKAI